MYHGGSGGHKTRNAESQCEFSTCKKMVHTVSQKEYVVNNIVKGAAGKGPVVFAQSICHRSCNLGPHPVTSPERPFHVDPPLLLME